MSTVPTGILRESCGSKVMQYSAGSYFGELAMLKAGLWNLASDSDIRYPVFFIFLPSPFCVSDLRCRLDSLLKFTKPRMNLVPRL